jgi:hypothetical protein
MIKGKFCFSPAIGMMRILSLAPVLVFLLSMPAICQIDSVSVDARIELKSSVDKSEVPFNRRATFTVQASWEGEQDRFSITPVGLPECENLEIVGSSSVNETRVEEGRTVSLKTFRFSLKPTQTGTGRIGSVLLGYVDNATQDTSALSTQPIEVQVTAAVKERGPVPRNILIFVVAVILIYVIYSARKRTKRIEITKEHTEEPMPREESPEEVALRDFNEISRRVQEGNVETFPSDIHRVLTGYLEAKYQIVTSGKTSEDVVNSLSNLDMPSERINLLKNLLAACDLIKYARDRAEKEKCLEIARQAREFVEQNR